MARAARPTPALAPAGEMRLTVLPGCGPALSEKLAARGLLTLQDLWLQLPRGYEDRTRIVPIRELQPGSAAQVEGVVEAVEKGFRYRPMLKVAVSDESRGTLVLRFFHFRAAQVAQFRPGTRLRCYGTPRLGPQGLEIVHPSYRVVEPDEVLGSALDPVYPQVEGVAPATLRRLIGLAVDRLPPEAALELLPVDWWADLGLPSLRRALVTVHRPAADDDIPALLSGRHPAQRRLALEELLAHHLSLRGQRRAHRAQAAQALHEDALVERLRGALPFELTGAQRRVFAEVARDLAQPVPMLRLVQGDVGCGVLASLTVQGDRRRCPSQLLKGLSPASGSRFLPLTFMEARPRGSSGVSSCWPAGWQRCTTAWPGLRGHGPKHPTDFAPRKAWSLSAYIQAG